MIGVFVGCTLLITGVQSICNNLLEIAEYPFLWLIEVNQKSRAKIFFKGVVISTLSGSTMTTGSTLLGLVNGGLMRVKDALVFMCGAQIGPLILIFAVFHMNFKFALVFLSAGFFAQLLTKTRFGAYFQNTFGLLFGIGLSALGLYFLKDGIIFFLNLNDQFLTSLKETPFALNYVSGVMIGGGLIYVLKSSLVSIILVSILGELGSFNLELLLSVVIGIHLFSYIPLYRISAVGNVYGKRLAAGQFLMSVFGFFIGTLVIIFYPWEWGINAGLLVLCLFTFIRSVNVLLFLIFVGKIRKFFYRIYPEPRQKSNFELENPGRTRDMVPAMSLIQSSLHLAKFKDVVDRLFNLTESYLQESEASGRTLAKIKDYERITDNMYRETSHFLQKLIENSLTDNQAKMVHSHQRIADSLENIADYVDKVASYNTRYIQSGGDAHWRGDFLAFFREIKAFYDHVSKTLPVAPHDDENKIFVRSQKLKIAAESLREDHLRRLTEFDGDPKNLITYSDMVVSARKIRGHTLKLYQKLL